MKALILHDHADTYDNPDVADTFEQIADVSDSLGRMGIECETELFSSDIPCMRKMLSSKTFDFVFNLVESIDGRGIFIHFAPVLFDSMNISYTGASSETLFLTSNKLASKRLMLSAGLPTASWMEYRGIRSMNPDGCRYIIKSYWEHASIGIDSGSIFTFDSHESAFAAFEEKRKTLGTDIFAEKFISGREFNISVISNSDRSFRVLSPAEMKWDGKCAGDGIMNYDAKWNDASEVYNQTCRTFECPEGDEGLFDRLTSLTRETARVFSLNGYSRVDFRTDGSGNIFILEVNANPCLALSSGIAAACINEGIPYDVFIKQIIDSRIVR